MLSVLASWFGVVEIFSSDGLEAELATDRAGSAAEQVCVSSQRRMSKRMRC